MHECYSVDVFKKEGLHDIEKVVMHGFMHGILILKMDEEARTSVQPAWRAD
jgi:hypothetical protein